MEVRFTEHELIMKLSIEYGYQELEKLFKTKNYIENGCLKNNDSYKSFTKKVSAICESWEKLKKKKGEPAIYILYGVKDQADAIEDKRKTNGLTEDDVVMRKFVYNRLNELELSNARSYYQFAVECGLVNVNDLSKVNMSNSLVSIYDTLDDSKIILNDFIQTLKQRNTDVIKMAFKWLVANDYIHTEQVYMAVVNKKAKAITKEFYDQLRCEFLEIISCSSNMSESLFRFKKANPQFIRDDEIYIFEKVKKLYQSYNIDSVFVAVSVTLHNKDLFDEISICDFRKAYINKLVYLTERKQKRNDNKNATYLSKRFVSYNTYLLVQHLPFNVEIDDSYLEGTEAIKTAVFIKQMKETSEFDEFFSIDNVTAPKDAVITESDKQPLTLDDILADVEMPAYENLYYKQSIHNASNQHTYNDELAKAIKMINFH